MGHTDYELKNYGNKSVSEFPGLEERDTPLYAINKSLLGIDYCLKGILKKDWRGTRTGRGP